MIKNYILKSLMEQLWYLRLIMLCGFCWVIIRVVLAWRLLVIKSVLFVKALRKEIRPFLGNWSSFYIYFLFRLIIWDRFILYSLSSIPFCFCISICNFVFPLLFSYSPFVLLFVFLYSLFCILYSLLYFCIPCFIFIFPFYFCIPLFYS